MHCSCTYSCCMYNPMNESSLLSFSFPIRITFSEAILTPIAAAYQIAL